MSSYGEARILVDSRTVGRMRVLSISHAQAIYPRLEIGLGCTLQDNPESDFGEGGPITSFELRDLAGELRLTEHADTIGSLTWAGARQHVRSSSYGSEKQLKAMCDLDAFRLERIERHRDGGEPIFWVELWPTLMDQHGYLDNEVSPIQMRVPRDRWIEFISAVRDQRFSILEIAFSASDAARFKAAVKHIREARSRIDRGDYDEAVAGCRRVIEALTRELKVDDLWSLLAAWSDDRRAKEYAGIISKVKQLASYAIHDLGQPQVTYSRAEALFIVNTTENLLALIGVI